MSESSRCAANDPDLPPGVSIVGLGAMCPAGQGVFALWQSLFEPPPFPVSNAHAGLPNDGRSWRHGHAFPKPTHSLMSGAKESRFESLAINAIVEACTDARMDLPPWRGVSLGLAIGTAAGDTEPSEHARLSGAAASFEGCNPYAVADRLADLLGLAIDGPVFAVSNACAAALYALTQAVDLILDGTVDAMLVVGTEVLSRVTQSGLHRMTALDPYRCRPFDADRQGTVLGEGAAALLLASPELAARLGRVAYCRVIGHGASCDSHHPTAPQPEGRDIRAAMQRALQSSGLSPQQIGMVVPHGTGTPLNDQIEGDLLCEVFGESISNMHLLPIKSHLGHCAGASGAFSAVVAAKAIACGKVPPTLHIDQVDPKVALRFSREPVEFAPATHRSAVINAYGFGGNNVSVVLEGMLRG